MYAMHVICRQIFCCTRDKVARYKSMPKFPLGLSGEIVRCNSAWSVSHNRQYVSGTSTASLPLSSDGNGPFQSTPNVCASPQFHSLNNYSTHISELLQRGSLLIDQSWIGEIPCSDDNWRLFQPLQNVWREGLIRLRKTLQAIHINIKDLHFFHKVAIK